MKKIAISVTTFGLMLTLFSPLFTATAADDIKLKDGKIDKIEAPKGTSKTTPEDIIKNILSAVYWIAGSISVLVIVICGIMIITADGDSQKVATARRGIVYALVGLLIVISAFIITGVIQNLGGLE